MYVRHIVRRTSKWRDSLSIRTLHEKMLKCNISNFVKNSHVIALIKTRLMKQKEDFLAKLCIFFFQKQFLVCLFFVAF